MNSSKKKEAGGSINASGAFEGDIGHPLDNGHSTLSWVGSTLDATAFLYIAPFLDARTSLKRVAP
jgi:hypothetical protein